MYTLSQLTGIPISIKTTISNLPLSPKSSVVQKGLVDRNPELTVGQFINFGSTSLGITQASYNDIQLFIQTLINNNAQEVSPYAFNEHVKKVGTQTTVFGEDSLFSEATMPATIESKRGLLISLWGDITIGELLSLSARDFFDWRTELTQLQRYYKKMLMEQANPIINDYKPDVVLGGKLYLSEIPPELKNVYQTTFHIHKGLKSNLSYVLFKSESYQTQKSIQNIRKHFVDLQLKRDKKQKKTRNIKLQACFVESTDLRFESPLANVKLGTVVEQFFRDVSLHLPSFNPTIADFLDSEPSEYINSLNVDIKDIESLKDALRSQLKKTITENSLNETQDDFYAQGIDRYTILDAPPGCGKTHSLVHRLEHHCKQLNSFYDARKILVLSFTRNAVNELRQRLFELTHQSPQKNLDLIRIQTFDSFAYQTLLSHPALEPTDDFDANITRVKALLIEGIAQDRVLNDIKWIYIDEYQDLVGCRADLTLELTKLVKKNVGSVSLLGDPCQQIMNFQIKKGGTKNSKFLTEFSLLAGRRISRLSLSKSYRFTTTIQQDRVKRMRELMLNSSVNLPILSTEVEQSILWREIGSSSAILCTRNIDCLLIYDLLRTEGKAVKLNHGVDRVMVPTWIFDVFSDWQQAYMSLDTYRLRCNRKQIECMSTIQYLNSMGVVSDERIDVVSLVNIIETRGGIDASDDINTITISTVHKAKGLQYPVVAYFPKNSVINEDARNEQYVAVTRAQEEFYLLSDSEIPAVWSKWDAPYTNGEHYYLEGIKEMDLTSFFPFPEQVSKSDISLLNSSSDILYEVQAYLDDVYLVAVLPNGKTIRLYATPRLKQCPEFKYGKLKRKSISPSQFSTFVYTGEDQRLELMLGPTCLIKMPLVEGFWSAKNEEE